MTIPVPQEPDDPRYVANGIDADGNLTFKQVGIEDINYTGRFGALATSTTENTISIGEKFFTLDFDDGKFRVGDDILITALDPDCFMWGEIIGSDTVASPLRLRVYVDDISSLTGTFSGWTLQVVARPKPGIEKDTSTSSVDPTGAGPFTFTVTASKFFPLGGTLLIKPTTDRSLALLGKVKAYSSTSLVVEKTFTNATVSQSYTSWAIALLDAPTTALTLSEQEGLFIRYHDFVTGFRVMPGRIRDFTDTIDLVITDTLTKSLASDFSHGDSNGSHVKVQGTGTISSSGTTVTGTGSNLSTLFGNTSPVEPDGWGFYDYGTEILPLANLKTSEVSAIINPVITVDNASASILTATSATAATTNTALSASNDAYYRGGWVAPALSTETLYYGVVLIRRDSDGAIDCCLSSANKNFVPDLPSGYTYYRVIGVIGVRTDTGQPSLYSIYQRHSVQAEGLWGNPLSYAAEPRGIAISSALDITSALTSDGHGFAYTLDLAADGVTNAKLANMAAYTLKMNNTGSAADPTDTAITALTEKTALVDDDLVLIVDSEASNVMKKAKKSNIGGGTSFPADMGLITESATTTFDLGTIV